MRNVTFLIEIRLFFSIFFTTTKSIVTGTPCLYVDLQNMPHVDQRLPSFCLNTSRYNLHSFRDKSNLSGYIQSIVHLGFKRVNLKSSQRLVNENTNRSSLQSDQVGLFKPEPRAKVGPARLCASHNMLAGNSSHGCLI